MFSSLYIGSSGIVTAIRLATRTVYLNYYGVYMGIAWRFWVPPGGIVLGIPPPTREIYKIYDIYEK